MKLIIGCSLLLLASYLHAANPITLQVNASNPEFVVMLPANPTTGYQLNVKQYDSKVLKLLGQEFLPPKSKLIGAGGKMKFTFRRIDQNISSTQILFINARSWEPATSGITYSVTVQFVD